MSAQHTPGLLRKPGASVRRGLSCIRSEMAGVADAKASERDTDSRRDAADIRAALGYIDAAIAKATGSTS